MLEAASQLSAMYAPTALSVSVASNWWGRSGTSVPAILSPVDDAEIAPRRLSLVVACKVQTMMTAVLVGAALSSAALAGGFGSKRVLASNKPKTKKTPKKSKTPKKQQRMEQLLLRSLHVQDTWERMSSVIPSFGAMTRSSEVAPSSHDLGLFAREPLDENRIASLYPVHALGSGTEFCLTSGDENNAYFGAKDEVEAPYRVETCHRSLAGWADDLWIDANPSLPDTPGWLGHRANDAAAIACADDDAAPPSEARVLEYYAQCAERANVVLVPVGDAAPLMCLWTIRPIAAGEELLQIYGHDYWLTRGQHGSLAPRSEAVRSTYTEAVRAAAYRCWKSHMDDAVLHGKLADQYPDEVELLEGILEAPS